ncbi:DUF485 domain-containing protein [Brevibacillus sp. HB1.2]|uniref:DUF485 domain-containing protein n=1 Tax=Brevibacillus porteri TaxID=2126350 RepID=A0ABX5FG01_9BACL|nr:MULTISPECIES: DUF485 domain-containing protein [Brevibacillus]ATF12733.1 DUF485 domain-containing protein [Brevibacillus brevis X23]MBY0084686.1 DUF485 domain-containing protein [Brevibacillus brevis]MCC8435766.1 DUF485 domain-containing protein [Brevibacillus sp. M2.1A]MCE0448971.1 DUF485 domain-containing protein [Brevibacillus sp. AF8]MDC0763868.1 DUF485 domain-containing protein [Brevibacillus sp. AG]
MGKSASAKKAEDQKKDAVDYAKVIQSATFKELLRRKKAFILPSSIFFFVFYFTLPILTSYFTVLNQPAFGAISWAWVFAFAQFVMTWGLCILYTRRAEQFDQLVEKIKQEAGGRG